MSDVQDPARIQADDSLPSRSARLTRSYQLLAFTSADLRLLPPTADSLLANFRSNACSAPPFRRARPAPPHSRTPPPPRFSKIGHTKSIKSVLPPASAQGIVPAPWAVRWEQNG